jgi:hypothetical protein
MPSLRRAQHRISVAIQRYTLLRLSIPLHFLASLCIAFAKRFSALPLRCFTFHCSSVALLNDSRPCHSIAALCHADAPHSFAFPLLYAS